MKIIAGVELSSLDLGVLLYDHRSLRLAVLNACEGARGSRDDPFAGTAQTLVQQGISAVIAMQFEITDEAAITLAQEFYGALADNYPVDAALAEARKALFAEGHGVEWGTPVLYMHAPDGRIFDIAPASASPTVPPKPAAHSAPARPVDLPATIIVQQGQLADLYTQALSFFYTERWDKAVELLSQIMSQQANYEGAAPKLKEARRQQKLAQLYTEARAAYESGSWALAIEWLEAISSIDADYKDTSVKLSRSPPPKVTRRPVCRGAGATPDTGVACSPKHF